jgi:regulatory protein
MKNRSVGEIDVSETVHDLHDQNQSQEPTQRERPDEVPQRLYNAAIRYLGAREHTVTELRQKIARKFGCEFSDSEVDALLAELQAQGLQSDARYADVAVRSRVARGYGPYYIEQSLRAKGVAAEIVHETESWQSADWLQLALRVKERKFPLVTGETRYEDPKAWQKAVRSLQQKGFSSAIVARVIGA